MLFVILKGEIVRKLTAPLILLVLLLGVVVVAAAAPPSQTDTTPRITSFITSATSVERSHLVNRTARIPVSWNTANRPTSANLIFEQILPNGQILNVELPRTIPWVASEGNGVVAPVLPSGSATEIVIRVRLTDLLTVRDYDEKRITLPISNSGSDQNRPAITEFSTCCPNVSASQLNAHTARMPVHWNTVNRPVTANLFFEQVLADGRVVNVELPRSNPYVASSGDGMVAPVVPGGSATTLTFRLRLIDTLTNQTLDTRELTAHVVADEPGEALIQTFATNVTSVLRSELNARTLRIPVTFAVINRPENSNLVFLQVLDNGRAQNVELPRPNPIIPSSGSGVVAPVPPGGASNTLRLVLQVVDLTTRAILDVRELTLPIVDAPTPPPAPVIRFFTTDLASVDINKLANRTERVPVAWAVDNRPANSNLLFEQVYPDGGFLNVELPRTVMLVPSEGVGVVAPTLPNSQQIVLRVRLVNMRTNQTLAVKELSLPISGTPAQGAQPTPSGNTRIDSFAITQHANIAGESMTAEWRTQNAQVVTLTLSTAGDPVPAQVMANVPTSGSYTFEVPDHFAGLSAVLSLSAYPLPGAAPITSTIDVPMFGCEHVLWFVGAGCAKDAAVETTGTIQQFERGMMLRRGDTGDIYLLLSDNSLSRPGTPSGIAVGDVPASVQGPGASFEAAWLTHEGDASTTLTRDRIGWATGPEGSYMMTLQYASVNPSTGGNDLLLSMPDGRILRIAGGRWAWNVR